MPGIRQKIRQKRAYDQKTGIRIYPVGTWVLYWYPSKGRRKLGLGWTGPYLVLDNAMGWVLKIQKDPDSKIKMVHINDLKKYTGHTSQLPWVKFHGNPEKEAIETQKDVSKSDKETEGTDLNSKEPEEEEFKKGGNLTQAIESEGHSSPGDTQTIESEGHSFPGDKWDQGSELLEIEDQDLNFESSENKKPSENKEPSDNKEPFRRLEREKKTPDLLEAQQYRRSKRKKKPPDRLEYS